MAREPTGWYAGISAAIEIAASAVDASFVVADVLIIPSLLLILPDPPFPHNEPRILQIVYLHSIFNGLSWKLTFK